MNNLTVKEVNFMGDSLLATQDIYGNIWAGVSHICNGIGFTKGQKDRQILNVQTDEVISRGCLKFEAGVFDPNNETVALRLDYVPLWLAKISITPAMKEENPKLVEKLIDYQLKVKDILAQAFLPQYQQSNKKPLDLKAVSVIAKASKGNMPIVLDSLAKIGYDIEGLNVQPQHNASNNDMLSIINRTIELIDNMIYENISLAQYIATDEANNFICIDFTRLYKEFIKYIRANNIEFNCLSEKDFKQQLKKVNYCITNRYVKKLKIFSPTAKQFCSKPVHCFKLDLEQLNNEMPLKIL